MADNTGRFLEGLIVGGILGFVVGMLSAPRSGAELRRQLADSSEDLYKQASDQITDISSKTGTAINDIKDRSGEVVKKASDGVQHTRDQVAHKLQELAGQSTKVLVDDVESATSGS